MRRSAAPSAVAPVDEHGRGQLGDLVGLRWPVERTQSSKRVRTIA